MKYKMSNDDTLWLSGEGEFIRHACVERNGHKFELTILKDRNIYVLNEVVTFSDGFVLVQNIMALSLDYVMKVYNNHKDGYSNSSFA